MFVLGVGAQKAGTTWLYSQLSRDALFSPLERKELHYWDQRYGLHQPGVKSLNDVRKWFKADDPMRSAPPTPNARFLAADYDYFDRIQTGLNLPSGNQITERLVADITPAYSGLPLFVWRKIADELHLRNIEFRIIFSMRDPVSRITSALHHDLRGGRIRLENGLNAMALPLAVSWAYQLRTRYELTLANLESAFPKEKIFVMFTEKIRTDEHQHLALEAFLGMRLDYFDREETRNGGRYPPLEVETQMALARLYKPTYLDLEARYPALPQIWPGFELLTL